MPEAQRLFDPHGWANMRAACECPENRLIVRDGFLSVFGQVRKGYLICSCMICDRVVQVDLATGRKKRVVVH